MIKNEAHYKITKQQIEMFKNELVLNTTERDAIQSLLNELESQVRKYETSTFYERHYDPLYGQTNLKLRKCAKIHMDQILDVFCSGFSNTEKYNKTWDVLQNYIKITNDLKCLPQK